MPQSYTNPEIRNGFLSLREKNMDMVERPTLIRKKKSRWPRILVRIILTFIGMVLVCAAWSFFAGPQELLGSHTVALIRTSTRVETIRFKEAEPKDEPFKFEIKDYPISYQGKTQGQDFTNRLADVLLNPRTYMGFNDNTCLIEPGVGFRLWSGRECVEVILCYHCGQMLVAAKNSGGQVTHTAYTEFNFVRPALVKLAKEAFPHDPEIQGLAEHP